MICDHCEQDKEDVSERTDPVLAQLYDEEDWSFWCDDCWLDRSYDI